LKKDVAELMHKPELIHAELVTGTYPFHFDPELEKVEFTPCKGWFGGERTEDIGGFKSKIFELSGFEWKITSRKRDDASQKEKGVISLPSDYFQTKTTDPRKKGYGLLYPSGFFLSMLTPSRKTVSQIKTFQGNNLVVPRIST